MLNKLNIKTKLFLLVGIPSLALVCMMLFLILQMVRDLYTIQHGQALGQLVVTLGEVAHELQKERGMSAGFLSSKGSKFADRLPPQREASDIAIAQLEHAITQVDLNTLEPDYRQRLVELPHSLLTLRNWRTIVSDLKANPPSSFRMYSDLIGNLLEVAARTSNQLHDAQLSRLTNTKSALLFLKERNGQERALLSGAFSAGRITAADYDVFQGLLIDQSNYLRTTSSFATATQMALLNDKLNQPINQDISTIESMVKTKGVGAELNYPPVTWFDQITAKIDLLREVEQQFSADIIAANHAQLNTAQTALLLYSIVLGITLFLTLWLALAIVRSVVSQIGGEPAFAAKIAHAIAGGKLDNVISLRTGDQTSLLASMLNMQHQLREQITADRHIATESLRIKNALDKASTNVMVADNDGNIIYMNVAMTKMMHACESALQRVLPDFNADYLIGKNFDDFHRNPIRQRNFLAEMNAEYISELTVAGYTFRLIFNPVINAQGERVGSVVEWTDRTNEASVQGELSTLLDAAVHGDFSQRLDLTGKDGFLKQMSQGMNQLVEIVSTGLADIAHVLNSIAQGDLTQQITADYSGTFGQLKLDTNTTVAQLREVVGRIQAVTLAINDTVDEIAAGNIDLSSRTKAQANALEKTAGTMEELNATVQKNAHNASQANQLASTAHITIQHGGDTVKAVTTTMSAIQTASSKIADIISVIDGIAFQTNILALNAAVEAARAGEQGRGFAVVAAEVRTLAQRSAQAAKEIKGLIADSMTTVDRGAALAQQAGAAMTEVVVSFQQVATLVADIADASREQSLGIAQVARAVTEIDTMTQQNAALVDAATIATDSLENQARDLVQAVSVFSNTGDVFVFNSES